MTTRSSPSPEPDAVLAGPPLFTLPREARVLCSVHEAEIAAVAGEIKAEGGKAVYRAIDVTRPMDLDGLVNLACERFGRLDVIINNASTGPLSRFDALKIDDWDAMINMNLNGALYGIAAALPVFTHPEIPLHTNASENDLRSFVIKRKISGGTMSSDGRSTRDTLLGLMKTCQKLELSFWHYLGDRLGSAHSPPAHRWRH